jgi:ABC-type polysaccharide/polyol phosphate export permease
MVLNPLVSFIEALRQILFGYSSIDISTLLRMYGWGFGALLSGYLIFRVAARGFTDVL